MRHVPSHPYEKEYTKYNILLFFFVKVFWQFYAINCFFEIRIGKKETGKEASLPCPIV